MKNNAFIVSILGLLIISVIFIVFLSQFVNAQSKYSPFYVNKTAEGKEYGIEYVRYNNSEYGFSIDYVNGAQPKDKLDVEKAAAENPDVEGPQILFIGGVPNPPFGTVPQTTQFDIYLNDSINMEKYIKRDLTGDPLLYGTNLGTKVINPVKPINITGLPGKSFKFEKMNGMVVTEAAYFSDGINTYHIAYSADPLYFKDEVFDHIVNSFHFIPIVKQIQSDDIENVDNNKDRTNENSQTNSNNQDDVNDKSNANNDDSKDDNDKKDNKNNDKDDNDRYASIRDALSKQGLHMIN